MRPIVGVRMASRKPNKPLGSQDHLQGTPLVCLCACHGRPLQYEGSQSFRVKRTPSTVHKGCDAKLDSSASAPPALVMNVFALVLFAPMIVFLVPRVIVAVAVLVAMVMVFPFGLDGGDCTSVLSLEVQFGQDGWAVQHTFQDHVSKACCLHGAEGIECGDDFLQPLNFPFLHPVGLVDQYEVRAFHLFDEQVHHRPSSSTLAQFRLLDQHLFGCVVFSKRRCIHHGDDSIQVGHFGDRELVFLCVLEEISHVLRFCHAGGFDDDPIEPLFPRIGEVAQVFDGVEELVGDGTARAPVVELHGVGQVERGGGGVVGPPDELGIDVDRGHVVHHASQLESTLVLDPMAQRGGLPCAQESRQQQHRRGLSFSHAVSPLLAP
eukprot:scaffold1053_cov332-Pavlova_lutheri.AAC.4